MKTINQEVLSVKVVKIKPPKKPKIQSTQTKQVKKPKPKGRSKCRGKKIRCVHTPDKSPSAVTITKYEPIIDLTRKDYIDNGTHRWATPELFYKSPEWRKVRRSVFKKYGRKCMKCGRKSYEINEHGIAVTMCVDHIKPVSKYPELVLDENNLQVLCKTCNKEKSYVDETDYRPSCENTTQ